MLSRIAALSRQGAVVQNVLKPSVLLANRRQFSVSNSDENKYAWHKTAWPAWQMYKDLAGSSGATMFSIGLASYLISKEIFIINDEVLLLFVMGGTGYQLAKAVGPSIGKMLDERRDTILENLNKGKEMHIKAFEDEIAAEREGEAAIENRKEFFDIVKANNEMRLEVEYRSRLHEVESEVKKRLDYQVDLQNLERSIEEEHISSWVEKQVIGSITAKQESDALAQCIKDLNALADARATA
ncbi:ATP synthase F(0) complex subunit B1, mitochondrial-like [Hydractinia symbiolongicarpus]|uniref:ATP synthase F(0) complex subunit B1, mitochondrial-like n=1 Tax=Hydractinia symbiolongicarpus TaxID=13093 RepID=UPI00254E5DE6|nr:ATP synthase F(0) complex subunit B1, mitochondrial-like [Hydractinia symbiolongicarpus]